jgi:hypothetical protein
MEIAVATELSSGAISSILESVPGIAHVLRSPVADAMVNLSRAAAGVGPFHIQDARELIRYAVRRGLIGSDEGDRVTAEVEGAAAVKAEKAATRKAAREARKRVAEREARGRGRGARKPAMRKAAPQGSKHGAPGGGKRASGGKRSPAKGKRRH